MSKLIRITDYNNKAETYYHYEITMGPDIRISSGNEIISLY